jgi:molybdate-binding protein
MVADHSADAALGLRAVASAFGLGFVPIETARCDLVVPSDLVDHPTIRIILDTLHTRRLREELASLPGYDSSHTGEVIAEV